MGPPRFAPRAAAWRSGARHRCGPCCCRSARQAIFSLHRGAAAEADSRIAAAKKAAEELLPLIRDNPTLRPGSYSNAGGCQGRTPGGRAAGTMEQAGSL